MTTLHLAPHTPAPPPVAVRVLVVDDDAVDRLSVKRLLGRTAFAAEVHEASDAPGAFAALKNGPFDVVFLDYELPGRDGLYVLQSLRAQEPGLPVIMLTGRDELDLAVDFMRNGAVDYLSKHTLSPQRIAASVRHALRLRHAELAARAADEARHEADELNRRLLAASPDCIQVLDPEGRLLSMNEGGMRAMGLRDLAGWVGRSWVELWTGADRGTAAGAIRAAAAGGSGRFVGYCPSVDGTPRWWDVLVAPLPDGNGNVRRLLALSREVPAPADVADLKRTVADLTADWAADRLSREDALSRLERIAQVVDRLLRQPA